jgi:hypothetical protein
VILTRNLEKQEVRVWVGFLWLRIRYNGKLLGTWHEPGGSIKPRNFMTSSETINFSRKNLYHGVCWLVGWLVDVWLTNPHDTLCSAVSQ